MQPSRKRHHIERPKFLPGLGRPVGLHPETTQHNRQVWYYRKGHDKRIRIPGEFGTPAFCEAYKAAHFGRASTGSDDEPGQNGLKPSDPASVAWLVDLYLAKRQFDAPKTLKQHRTVLDRFIKKNGSLPYAALNRKHIVEMQRMVAKGEHEGSNGVPAPAMANRIVSVLRTVYDWAMKADLPIETNPADGIQKISYDDETNHVWTDEEIERFEAYWLLGTRERLAYALMVYTGQASCDVVRMGKQHIKNGKLTFRRQKTDKPINVELPPDLVEAIAAADAKGVTGDLTFIISPKTGKPIKVDSLGAWFRAACDEAGVPECTCHGLRHVASKRVLEACAKRGENPIPILMGVFGYTLAVAERYVRKADLSNASDGRGHYLSKKKVAR